MPAPCDFLAFLNSRNIPACLDQAIQTRKPLGNSLIFQLGLLALGLHYNISVSTTEHGQKFLITCFPSFLLLSAALRTMVASV